MIDESKYPKTLVEEEVRSELIVPYLKSLVEPCYVEVGVFLGGNILRVYDRVPSIEAYGVDNFSYSNISSQSMEWAGVSKNKQFIDQVHDNLNIGLDEYKRNIAIIGMDSIKASMWFDYGEIDCLFLDGNHEYDYVRKELAAWIPKIKKGGLLVGHDWPEQGIQKAVREHFPNSEIKVSSTNGGYAILC